MDINTAQDTLERLTAQLDILTAKRDSVARTHGGGTRLHVANIHVCDMVFAIVRHNREVADYWGQA
jgi:hypothetical protein